MEIWKNIEGFNSYMVSNSGKFKSLMSGKERFFTGCKDSDGYLITTLTLNKKKYCKKLHRLVALAFIPNPENKPCVNHKDGDKLNNHIDNLEWCTVLENNIHAISTGLRSGVKGDKCSFYGKTGKLNHNSRPVINIDTNELFVSIKEASEFYGIKYHLLSKNLNGQNINKTNLRYHDVIVGLTTSPKSCVFEYSISYISGE